MPSAGRWALGLALAFLSGAAFLVSPWMSNLPYAVGALAVAVMLVLALAAGFVLSSWWAVLALAVVTAIGDWVGGWVVAQVSPGSIGATGGAVSAASGLFVWFAVLGLGPLILILLAGVGLGKRQGIALGQPHALSAGEAEVSRWLAAIGPLIAAGYLAPNLAYIQGDVVRIFSGILWAVALAASCLLAGWVLRSWWGFVAAPVVYTGVAALAGQMFGGVGGGNVWLVGFALYILLPAVVMSAIGTAIGMYGGGQRGPRPRYSQLAT